MTATFPTNLCQPKRSSLCFPDAYNLNLEQYKEAYDKSIQTGKKNRVYIRFNSQSMRFMMCNQQVQSQKDLSPFGDAVRWTCIWDAVRRHCIWDAVRWPCIWGAWVKHPTVLYLFSLSPGNFTVISRLPLTRLSPLGLFSPCWSRQQST